MRDCETAPKPGWEPCAARRAGRGGALWNAPWYPHQRAMWSSPALALALAACTAAAACSDPAAPEACTLGGFADGETTVREAPLGPFVRAAQITLPVSALGTTHALVFAEAAGTCGAPAATGRSLALLFCEPPTERTYIAVARSQFRCPGDNVLAIVEDAGGGDVTTGTAGTIRIEQAGTCALGTYSVTFGGDVIEGAFDAAVCDAP